MERGREREERGKWISGGSRASEGIGTGEERVFQWKRERKNGALPSSSGSTERG